MESNEQIEEQALAWLARRDSGRWSQAEQKELAEWLSSDAHRVLFLRLELVWERSARLKTFGVGRTPGAVPPPGEWRSAPFFERQPAPAARFAMKASAQKIAAIAAAVLLTVGVSLYVAKRISGDAYDTPVGAVASFPLKDGSSMTLNTATKVLVSLSSRERRVKLEAGEAFFDVAKDPTRPFVVEAGNRRIVAVGTRFSVRRDGREVRVIVTEGAVRIEPKGGGEGAKLLTAGTVVKTTRSSLRMQKKSLQDAEEALSWRSGYLVFEETSLAEAVAEVNRYTSQRIVIEDPELAALRVNGKFRATHAEDIVELLRNGFGVPVRKESGTIYLGAD
jgi:transmembrane sensor